MKTLSGRNVISFISPIQGLCFLCLFAPVRRAAAVPASSEPIIVQQSSSQVIHVPAEDNDRLDAAESVHETHYVDAYNTTPVFPYTDWFTAATNIQDAVDAATFTDTVFVADGVYNLTSGIVVDKQITLRSVNGPDVTIVDGGGSTGCFNLGSNACLLSGFTIRHGKVNSYGGAWNGSGGGVYCLDTASVVSNCIIRDNFSFLSGSGMYGGTAYNCTFSSNSVDTGNGSGMANGVAYNCIFSDNTRGGISGSTAVNCMISDNSGSRRGCGIYGGTAINCIISGNSTPIEGGGIYHGTAYHCVFTGNEAHAAGGGMFEATAINCIFIGNRADSGGGMYNSTAINCTIIGNEADLNGGGLVGGTATNCIIYYNQAGGTGNDTYSVSPRFSCASDLPHGSYGNITNAPLFADRFDKNFRLTDQSPCVNAGTTSAVAVVSDLDGLPRIVDYVVDLGAYEYQEILDSDGDLISDGYEVCYFGGKTNAEASADNDDDGQNNRDEYIAGMNPFDSGSLFMITNFFSTPEGALIEWPAAYGRRYQVLFSTNLLQAFQLLEDDISYPGHSCIDTVNTNGTCFYRVNVRLLE